MTITTMAVAVCIAATLAPASPAEQKLIGRRPRFLAVAAQLESRATSSVTA